MLPANELLPAIMLPDQQLLLRSVLQAEGWIAQPVLLAPHGLPAELLRVELRRMRQRLWLRQVM